MSFRSSLYPARTIFFCITLVVNSRNSPTSNRFTFTPSSVGGMFHTGLGGSTTRSLWCMSIIRRKLDHQSTLVRQNFFRHIKSQLVGILGKDILCIRVFDVFAVSSLVDQCRTYGGTRCCPYCQTYEHVRIRLKIYKSSSGVIYDCVYVKTRLQWIQKAWLLYLYKTCFFNYIAPFRALMIISIQLHRIVSFTTISSYFLPFIHYSAIFISRQNCNKTF